MKKINLLIIILTLFTLKSHSSSRQVETKNLKNGMKVYFIKDSSLPRVGFQTLIRVGRLNEPASMYGVSSLLAEMLDQGTQAKTSQQLIDSMADLGVNLGGSAGEEYTMVGMDSLSNLKEKAFDIYWEILTRPRFDKNDFARVQSSMIAGIKKKSDDPGSFASEAMSDFLWVGHPFGVSLEKELQTVQSLDVNQVRKFYEDFYYPENMQISIVGNIDENFKTRILSKLERWNIKNRAAQKVSLIEPQKIEHNQVRLLTKEKLAQTQIRIAQIGISRKNPDFIKLRIANEILGGGFASRLMQKVRDDLGLTYSISSNLSTTKDLGSLNISTFSKNESVGAALKETLKIYKEFALKGVSEKELNAAKAQLKGQFPRAIETADRLASNFMVFDFFGLDTSYFENYNQLVDAVTLSDLNGTIRKYYQPENLKILIYGDQNKILSQIEEYKPEIVLQKEI